MTSAQKPKLTLAWTLMLRLSAHLAARGSSRRSQWWGCVSATVHRCCCMDPPLHTHVGGSSPWALQARFLRETYKREVRGTP